MATYTEQIDAAFEKAKASGLTAKQAYDSIKAKLGTNASALSTLENVYGRVSTAEKQGASTSNTNTGVVSSKQGGSATPTPVSRQPSSSEVQQAGDMVRSARNSNQDVNALLKNYAPGSSMYNALISMGAVAPASTAPTQSTPSETMYTVDGKQYTLAQIDAAYSKATPDQRAALNAQTKLSYDVNTGKPSAYTTSNITDQQKSNKLDTTVDYSQVDEAGRQFKTGYDAYIEAQKGVYDIATQRQNQQYGYQGEDLTTSNTRALQDTETSLQKGLQSYDWQAQDAQKAIQRNREDYAKFTGQEVQDTARQLALNSTQFAKSLSAATKAYGQRGILNAGIQKSSLKEGVSEFGSDQGYFKTLSQRRLDAAGTNMTQAEEDYATQTGRIVTQKSQFQTASDLQKSRIGQDYSTNTGRLNTTKSQYAQDRSAGSQAMVAGLQQQGNTLYGQNQLSAVQLAQQQAEQAALDKLYGRTTTTRPNLLKNIY